MRRRRAPIYFVSAETEHERDIRPTSDTPPVSPQHSVLHRKAAECPRSDVAVSGHLGIEAVNINGVSPRRWVLDEWPGRAYAQTSFRTGTGENFERSNEEKDVSDRFRRVDSYNGWAASAALTSCPEQTFLLVPTEQHA